MALIKCSECGKEISDKAKTCPNCGCPVNKNQSKARAKKNNYFKLYINSLKNKNKKTIIFTSLTILIIIILSCIVFFKETTLYRFSNDYEIYENITGELTVNADDIRITLKGLEYLQENSIMQRMYNAVKGIKEVVPGL